jgi:hypothetical protein
MPTKNRKIPGNYLAAVSTLQRPSSCSSCSNSSSGSCTQQYSYAGVVNYNPSSHYVGVQATINARYGMLCGEGRGSSEEAHAYAWVGIQSATTPMRWAQVGYGLLRHASAIVKKVLYTECFGTNATPYQGFFYSSAPAEGSSAQYVCELVQQTGGHWQWEYSYGGSVFDTAPYDAYWNTPTNGAYLTYNGEILNLQDDMPGTVGNPCNFTSCQYKTNGGTYVNTAFTAGNMFTSDKCQWAAQFNTSTSLSIWDWCPLTS